MFLIIESLLSKFILEVCGSTGATWGTLEVLTLRDNTNSELCRYISLSVGMVFLVRYTYEHYNMIKAKTITPTESE